MSLPGTPPSWSLLSHLILQYRRLSERGGVVLGLEDYGYGSLSRVVFTNLELPEQLRQRLLGFPL